MIQIAIQIAGLNNDTSQFYYFSLRVVSASSKRLFSGSCTFSEVISVVLLSEIPLRHLFRVH